MLFAYARNAFEYIIKNIKFENDDYILLPDYNCDAVYQPIKKNKINHFFYRIDDYFSPDFQSIFDRAGKNLKAILVVNYFGQPLKINSLKQYCNDNNILLIEDNSHSYGGSHMNQKMGTIGDYGFSSPRKIINTPTGAILYSNNNNLNCKFPIKRAKVEYKKFLLNFATLNNYNLREKVKAYFRQENKFDNPLFPGEPDVDYFLPDLFSEALINMSNWDKISEKRIKNWYKWSIFIKQKKFQIIFDHPLEKSCPWLMPFYIDSPKKRLKLLEISSKNGLGLSTWPTLTNEALQTNNKLLDRWNKLVVINLNHTPSKYNEILFKDI